MILAIDTETNGLFTYGEGVRADDEGQPRMCALAAILVSEISEDGEIASSEKVDLLVKPDGWTVEPEAFAVNGLTQERLEAEGKPIADVLDVLDGLLDEADVVIGFNVNFDLKMTRAEYRRAGRPDRYGDVPKLCVMHATRSALKAKSIKLGEAVERLLDRPLADAHTAMADYRAALDLYFELRRRGQLPQPKRDIPRTEAA